MRYGIAVAAALVAGGLRALFYHSLGGGLPYLTFFPAVMFSAIYGGLAPGLITTVLSVAIASLWLDPVQTTVEPQLVKPLGIALFTAVSLFIVSVCERVRKATGQLKAERDPALRFAAIAESSDDAIVGKTLNGIVESWNPGAARLFGYAADEIIGRPITTLIPPDHLGEEEEILARIRRGERLEHFETIRQRKDGTLIDVSVTVSPIRDDKGRIIGASKIARDISQRRRDEAERAKLLASERAARADAENANRIKDEFLATLSHELRTPLNAILGWCELLQNNPSTEDLQQGVQTMWRNAKAQAKIVDDLLDMSRIIAGKIRLDIKRIDLSEVLQAAIETVTPAAKAKQIRLQSVLDPNARTFAGDQNRLLQVFWNLLINAIKFTPKGGRVQVLLERVNSQIEISVIDTGQGISPAFLPHVFDRFRQADASTTRVHGGLGLGLAIVRQLVELHGGTMRVKSGGEGQGATFTVVLPAQAVLPPDEPVDYLPAVAPPLHSEMSPLREASRIDLSGVSVVMVDDEADTRTLISRVLQGHGATVSTASSAQEALDSVRGSRPDVLISDIGMPGEDGYSLIGRIRALSTDEGGETPAVALTAYARSDDRTRAIAAGFQMHVTKPVEPSELLVVVASLAGRVG